MEISVDISIAGVILLLNRTVTPQSLAASVWIPLCLSPLLLNPFQLSICQYPINHHHYGVFKNIF